MKPTPEIRYLGLVECQIINLLSQKFVFRNMFYAEEQKGKDKLYFARRRLAAFVGLYLSWFRRGWDRTVAGLRAHTGGGRGEGEDWPEGANPASSATRQPAADARSPLVFGSTIEVLSCSNSLFLPPPAPALSLSLSLSCSL